MSEYDGVKLIGTSAMVKLSPGELMCQELIL